MDVERTVVDDLIILGGAVPDELRDHRKTVCTAGFSERLGLIRIYPVPPDAHLKRWDLVKIPLERNPQDTRKESWKIQGSKDKWTVLKTTIEKVDKITNRNKRIKIVEDLLEEYGGSCVEDFNERKDSLGFINPTITGHYYKSRDKYDKSVQSSLFHSESFKTINNYESQPRLVYECPQCRAKNGHDQQILEWGAYEWMRKQPENLEGVWDNLRLDDPDWKKTILIGNQFLHRNSFMVISIFRHKLPKQEGRV